MKSKVYLIGAGPGDPGLITVRGREILRQADVVIYDYLVDKRLLDETKDGAELICCDSLGKNILLRVSGYPKKIAFGGLSAEALAKADRYSDGFLIHNERINDLVIKKVKEGKKVIRLKNGDPSIFSRTSQELEPLVKNKIEFEIVPGVTAASAASSSSGIPLTDRRYASSCVFVTGHEDPKKLESSLDWGALAKNGTIVLYMAVENLSKIVKELTSAGRDPITPVAIIQNASLLTQKVLTGTLRDIAAKALKEKVKPPAVIIVGEVAKLERKFNRLNRTKRILFTGLSKERFFTKGKTYFHLPLIKIVPMESYEEFDEYLKNIKGFDWVVFSSRFGVEYFFKRLKNMGYDVRMLSGVKIAAIGNSTKTRLIDFGINADLVPREESSKGLLEEFKKIGMIGKRIFLPRSDISDKGLSDGFKRLGADAITSFAYKNVMPDDLPNFELEPFDEIMFTSPSGVINFKKKYKHVPAGVKVTSIGEVTKKEVKRQLSKGGYR